MKLSGTQREWISGVGRGHDAGARGAEVCRKDGRPTAGTVKAIRLELGRVPISLPGMSKPSPFRSFRTIPEIIRLAVMLYVRFPLSLRNVEDLLHERGIEISYGTVRFWWLRFGPMFATEIRRRRVSGLRSSRWRRHLDEVFVKINGRQHYLGERWTTKARCWRRLPPSTETRWLPSSSCES